MPSQADTHFAYQLPCHSRTTRILYNLDKSLIKTPETYGKYSQDGGRRGGISGQGGQCAGGQGSGT